MLPFESSKQWSTFPKRFKDPIIAVKTNTTKVCSVCDGPQNLLGKIPGF